jgi:hypothetical protein
MDAALGDAGSVSAQFHDFGAKVAIAVPPSSEVAHLP